MKYDVSVVVVRITEILNFRLITIRGLAMRLSTVKFEICSGIGNELRHWDRRFAVDSRPAAFWFDLWREYTANINSMIFGKEMYARLEPIVFNKYTFFKFAIIGIETGYVDEIDVLPVLKESLKNSLARYEGAVYGDFRKYDSKNMFFSGNLPKIFGFDIGPYSTNSGFEAIKVGSRDKYLDDTCVFMQVIN